jgi:protein-S-isoprenylcysteine O-methyltransferase Ste14
VTHTAGVAPARHHTVFYLLKVNPYRLFLYGIFGAAPVMLIYLLARSAPYGRHNRKGWGPCLGARAAWLVMEMPPLFVFDLLALGSGGLHGRSLALFALWQIHYVYRSFLYPVLMRSSPHTVPVLLVALGMSFNVANSYTNGWTLFRGLGAPGLDGSATPRFLLGLLLFAAGFAAHAWSDGVLRGLRRPGETGYRVPRGGLFELVSAPNYLGEMVQWIGWAVATWSAAGLGFALFTIANLLPRALSHHAWYRSRFPEYPDNRKAVIPGLL